MKQKNKNEKKVIAMMQRGRATSDKRKQSIVNTKIIGNLYQTNNGSNGGIKPESQFAAQ